MQARGFDAYLHLRQTKKRVYKKLLWRLPEKENMDFPRPSIQRRVLKESRAPFLFGIPLWIEGQVKSALSKWGRSVCIIPARNHTR